MKNNKSNPLVTQRSSSTSTSITPTQPSSSSFGVGDRVRCSNSMVGICRFIGTIDSKPGIWVGIDLGHDQDQDPIETSSWHGKGKNSGSVNGVVYFVCQPLCGIFFPISKVSAYPRNSVTTSLDFPISPPPRQSIDSSTLSPSPARARRQSAFPASTNNSTNNNNNNNNTPISTSNSSTPRPRPRPSLPARSTVLPRKPSLPPIPTSSKTLSLSTTSISSSSTTSSGTINKTQTLTRKSSSIKPTDHQPSNSNPNNFLHHLPPLPSTLDLTSPSSSKRFSPFTNPRTSNPFSKSTNCSKRSSVSHLPSTHTINNNTTTTQNIRPTSRASLKRPESVNSHYARAATPEWARQSRQRRPTSRLSLISNSDSKSSKNPSISSLDQFIPPQLPSISPEQLIGLQQRILELENQAEQNKLQHSQLETQHLEKCEELERELERSKESFNQSQQDQMLQLENTKQELNKNNQIELESLQEQLNKLNETLRLNQETSTQQSAQFEKERTELQSQLHQLRSAGQSLCGVYESKISDLEELRLEQLHKSELIAEELKATKMTLEELQKDAQLNQNHQTNQSSLSRSTSSPNHLEAVEIDNESLKADLKYTQERLSEVQDEAYQLKQELATEREQREQLTHTHDESLQQHILSVKGAREEVAMLDKEKVSLQYKLTQAETRLKETLETMEQERVELEGLRADVLASSSHPHPTHPSPRPNRQSETNHSISTATVTNTPTRGGSECSEHQKKTPSSNFRQDQLESELRDKQSRIEFLEAQLNRHSFSEQSKTSVDSNHQIDSQPIMDQEKMLVIQKYQRLLLVKDEENLKLINKLEELEEELENQPKSRFKNLSPARGATIGYDHQASPRLRHKTSTQSLNRSPRPTIMSRSISCKTIDESSPVGELAKASQQIVGLKLIARQSNDERAKFEKFNLELKEEIEELKQDNRLLEQKLAKFVKSGQMKMGSNRMRSETIGLNRSYSIQELGIENEIGMLGEIGNQQKPSHSGSSATANESDHRVHQLQAGEVVIGDYKKVKKLELEIDQLKSQLTFLEQKHGREVAALNKEVSELESIIESKIFQEEELEEEIQLLNEQLKRSVSGRPQERSQSIGGTGMGADLQRRSSKVWRRRTLETGQQPSQNHKRFSGLDGLEEETVEDDSGLHNQLIEEEEPLDDHSVGIDDHPTRMIVTDHDAQDSSLNLYSHLSSLSLHDNLNHVHSHHLQDPNHNSHSSEDGTDIDNHNDDDANETCELCDRPGHQLETCPIFSTDS